jgi:hypothetical protein
LSARAASSSSSQLVGCQFGGVLDAGRFEQVDAGVDHAVVGAEGDAVALALERHQALQALGDVVPALPVVDAAPPTS